MRPLLALLLLGLCTPCAAQTLDSIDATLQLLFSGSDITQIDLSNLDTAQLLRNLQLLAADNPGDPQYAALVSAVVKLIEDQHADNTVLATLCPTGSYIDPGTKLCVACLPGTYSATPSSQANSPAVCLSCSAGTYSNKTGASAASDCLGCLPGSWSSVVGASSASVCQSCGAGSTSVVGAQGPGACVCGGGFAQFNGSCAPCEAGTWCTGGVKNLCPGYLQGKSTSPPMSSSIDACYCKAGYYNWAYKLDGCLDCPENSFCDGSQLASNYGQVFSCPANSVSPPFSTKVEDCACANSFRRRWSSPFDRQWRVSAGACNCTNTVPCAALDAPDCLRCGSNENCNTGILNCKQGYLGRVGADALQYMPFWAPNTATQTYSIEPAGAEVVRLTFTTIQLCSGVTLRLSMCSDSACTARKSWTTGNTYTTITGTQTTPRIYVTSTGFPVVKLDLLFTASCGSPFMLSYGSEIACSDKNQLGGVPTSVTNLESMEALSSFYVPDLSWPIVLWVGDIFGVPDTTVPLDVWNASVGGSTVLNPSWGINKWIPTDAGTYWLVDLSFTTRVRQVQVVPTDPRRDSPVRVYYNVANNKFVLSGDVVGSSSPDILLVMKDILTMTRQSSGNAVVLLSSYSNSTSFTLLGGSKVSGQSTVTRFEPSLTWDTEGYPSGVYYYANVASFTAVLMGRIILHPLGGGQSCVQCFQGEYCYQGNVLKCPVNSRSPPGSTSESSCVCQTGFARSNVDLDAYTNGQIVDSGGRHSCVIDQLELLWCWGANDRGQMGQTTVSFTPTATPVQVPGLTMVKKISLGEDFTCVIWGWDLRVRCWGANDFGQLGLDDNRNTISLVTTDAKLGEGGSVFYSTKSLACAGQSCCAIVTRNEDALTCWGKGDRGQLGWGSSGYNLMNIGTGITMQSSTRYSFKSMGAALPSGAVAYVNVTMAAEHGCALGQVGEVVCWGHNAFGEVGAGVTTSYMMPTLIDIGGAAKMVNCFSYVCCAIIKDLYAVRCWGRAFNGRLGTGIFDVGKTAQSMGSNLQSVNLGASSLVMDVNVGGEQTCVLLSNNFVKCWGKLGSNIVGDAPAADLMNMLPNVALVDNRLALQIAGKGTTTCAVTTDYRVVCWALDNANKQLGGTAMSSSALGGIVLALADLKNVTVLRSAGSPTQLNCMVCDRDTYCDGQGGLPYSCPAGTTSPVQSTNINDCKCLPGYKQLPDYSCQQCSGAEYCVLGQAYTCLRFSATVAPGSTDISSCQCDRGYYKDSQVGCTACPLGAYKDAVGNAGSCTPCPPGTRNGTLALATSAGCTQCPAGSSAVGGSSVCTPCPDGTAAAPGSSACTVCGPGFFSPPLGSACAACAAGTFDAPPQDGRQDTCSPCVAGKFSAVRNATLESTCADCAAGTFSSGGASTCTACGAGQYSETGAMSCLSCPQNSTSQPGSPLSQCKCVAGYYKSVIAGSAFACVQCPPGQFASFDSTQCSQCPPGTANVAGGGTSSSSCTPCGPGRYASTGANACQPCRNTTFTAGPTAETCTPCSVGFYSPNGASQCTACAAGWYSLVPIASAFDCLPCPAGSYCVGADAALSGGVPQVQPCPLGSFSNVTKVKSASQCLPCPANFFCPSPVLRGACPPGTRSNASSPSQLRCYCTAGYTCNYNKFVNAVVRLVMTESDFSGDVRQAFLLAVASAARTSADKVKIVKVVPVSSGSNRRRLLQVSGGNATLARNGTSSASLMHFLLEIYGGSGSSLERDLWGALSAVGLESGEGRGLAWIEPHEVVVRKK